MFEMSMNYTKLIEENNELKRQMMGKKKNNPVLDKSRNMMDLLGDIDKEEVETSNQQYEDRISQLLG